MIPTIATPKASMRKSCSSRNHFRTPIQQDRGQHDAEAGCPCRRARRSREMIAIREGESSPGSRKVWRVAKNVPAKPAEHGADRECRQLGVGRVVMPKRAGRPISSSRSASHARPSGSLRMRKVKKLVTSASASPSSRGRSPRLSARVVEAKNSWNVRPPEADSRPKSRPNKVGRGMPEMPLDRWSGWSS